eukprot:gnl/TRDRNA2_/TRDRNA2_175492_c0_seq5.p1 gnl/TRDRNA2_/TRDRNA2_175492_c0~~gnl/TRDRNA2_/TRDRNA2_175492_c0_seq5.p1  ORF type:complete len:256 (+),score=2.85 gnl/TRDRNA2_/TRDRNA2_175492_c0_seq5:110-769(+)
MCVVVGCIDGLRVSVDQHPAETSLPPLGIPDVILQTPILWKHIEQNVNLATSMLYGTPNERAQHVETARLINSRFAFGKPNDNIAAAGLVVHGFKEHNPWEASQPNVTLAPLRNIISASLMNARVPYSWSLWSSVGRKGSVRGSAGVIIAPKAAASSLRCSWPADAHTDMVVCAKETSECVSGCVVNRPGREWCSRGKLSNQPCAFRQEQQQEVLDEIQ